MALKISSLVLTGCVKIAVTETGELDKVKGVALCLGYTVADGAFENSIDLFDSLGEYQGYYDPNAGIGAIWIDEDSEAYFKFNNLGGESWILNLSK